VAASAIVYGQMKTMHCGYWCR